MKDHDISFEIISTDIETDSVLVRPWSSLYKNPPSEYPIYNIAISNLVSEQDINTQIARVCLPIVKSTLLRESSAFDALVGYITENTNVVHTLSSVSDIDGSVTVPNLSAAEPLLTTTANTDINFIT